MIRFALKCACGHRFESWFRDTAACEELMAAGHLTWPACGGGPVSKAPMAPFVASARSAERAETEAKLDERLRAALIKLRDAVESSSENVGTAFAEEARKIHYGEAPKRAIYGDATSEEIEELTEEEVEFSRIPWLPKGNS